MIRLRRLIVTLFIVFLPLCILTVHIERKLSKIESHFTYKKRFLEESLPTIEILSLGSSNAYYGINPDHFSYKGFNLANLAQSMYYDKELTLKYIDKMPSLRVVLLPIIFFTVGMDHRTFSENWRMYFYRQFFQIPLETTKRKFDWAFLFDARNFSKIALYDERTIEFFFSRFKNRETIHCAPNGWFISDSQHLELKGDPGPLAAASHNHDAKVENFEYNLGFTDDLVKELKARSVTPVLIQLPSHPSYHEALNKEKLAILNERLDLLAKENSISRFDYTQDSRFILEDYTIMPDHLNIIGSSKLSKIINEDILKPIFENKSR